MNITSIAHHEMAQEKNDRAKKNFVNEALRNCETVSDAKKLIKLGADLESKDEFGRTALHNCVIRDCPEVIKFLIKKGANIEAQDEDRKTPLMFCCSKETTEILVAAGSNIFAYDRFGQDSISNIQNRSVNKILREIIRIRKKISPKDPTVISANQRFNANFIKRRYQNKRKTERLDFIN